jgi:hypothetical protein
MSRKRKKPRKRRRKRQRLKRSLEVLHKSLQLEVCILLHLLGLEHIIMDGMEFNGV